MKTITLISLLAIVFNLGHAQSNPEQNIETYNAYFDEYGQSINVLNFSKKKSSFLYYSRTTKVDSINVHSLKENFKFGKLNEIENTQLRHYLAKHFSNKLLLKNTIILTYNDTIYGDNYRNRHCCAVEKRTDLSEIYFKNSAIYDKNQKRNQKYLAKKNASALYLYNYNKGFVYKTKYHTKHKKPEILARVFKTPKTGVIILKPNGQYFYYYSLIQEYVYNLIKKDWAPYIEDYTYSKEYLPIEPIGFFLKSKQELLRPKVIVSSYSRSYGVKKKRRLKRPITIRSLPANALIFTSKPKLESYIRRSNVFFTSADY